MTLKHESPEDPDIANEQFSKLVAGIKDDLTAAIQPHIDALNTDGYDSVPRPMSKGMETSTDLKKQIPLGHIAFKGDFDKPRPEDEQ